MKESFYSGMKRTKNYKLTMNLPLKSLNKQKVTDVIKENQKLQKQLKEIEPVKIPKPKVSADQIRKVREAIELAETKIKVDSKKNKEIIKEKENILLAAKNELNLLEAHIGEINK